MLQRILVPLDGSRRAERALPTACRLAQARNGTLVLLRIVNTDWPSPAQDTLAQQLPLTARFEAENYLKSVKEMDLLQNVHVETVTQSGSEAAEILACIRNQFIDLVVLCTHGYTGLQRWVVGSVAEKVSRHATVPVLLLREDGTGSVDAYLDTTQPLRILIPLDGSRFAKAAIEPAAELLNGLAGQRGGLLHLIKVVKHHYRDEHVPQAGHCKEDHFYSKANVYLQHVADEIHTGKLLSGIPQQHITVTWSVVVDPDSAGAIIRVAENGEETGNAELVGGCDIIAMSTHGLSGIPLWTMGSIAERVRIGTKLPVLLVRPQGM